MVHYRVFQVLALFLILLLYFHYHASAYSSFVTGFLLARKLQLILYQLINGLKIAGTSGFYFTQGGMSHLLCVLVPSVPQQSACSKSFDVAVSFFR